MGGVDPPPWMFGHFPLQKNPLDHLSKISHTPSPMNTKVTIQTAQTFTGHGLYGNSSLILKSRFVTKRDCPGRLTAWKAKVAMRAMPAINAAACNATFRWLDRARRSCSHRHSARRPRDTMNALKGPKKSTSSKMPCSTNLAESCQNGGFGFFGGEWIFTSPVADNSPPSVHKPSQIWEGLQMGGGGINDLGRFIFTTHFTSLKCFVCKKSRAP